MANTDLRVKRTKAVLKDNFKEMFLNMDYEKITIKELCEKSLINRRTFYLHYETIDDLLVEILEEIAQEFVDYTKDYDHFANPDRLIIDYFTFSNNNKLYEKINHDTNYVYIKDILTSKLGENKESDNIFKSIRKYDIFTQRILASYLNGATVAMYKTWYNDGKKVPIEEVSKMATKLIKNGILTMTKENQ